MQLYKYSSSEIKLQPLCQLFKKKKKRKKDKEKTVK